MVRPFAVIGFTVFFTTAILFKFETGVTVTAFAVFTVALVVSLFIKSVRKHGFLPCFFSSGAIACVFLLCAVNFTYLPALAYDGMMNCAVKAELTSQPETEYGNYYYEAHAVSINGKDADVKIRLVFSTPPEADPYDIIEGKFNLYALGTSSESLLQSYKAQGIFLGGYPVNDAYSVTNVTEKDKPLAKKFIDIRASIKNSLYRVLPDDRGDLAVALILGDKSSLSDDIYSDFKEIGISHVICVSGFHLSLWSMFILKILRNTGMNEKFASVFAGVGVVAFMAIAGFTYSVVRSGIMMLVFLLQNIIMRRRDSLNSLGFALAFIAVFNPFAMGSVSLQLSALATLGIILYNQYISPSLNEKINKIKYEYIRKVLKTLVSLFMVTASATAFTLPVSLPLYGSFNFLCFFANMVAVTLAGYCMVLCALGAFLGTFWVHNPFVLTGGALARFLINFADYVAEFDFLTFRINDDKVIILLCGLFAFCLITVIVSYFKRPVYRLASILCAVMFTVTIVAFSSYESKETKITVIDCGNGTSVLVSCNGENMLVGCGGTEFLGSMHISRAISDNGGGIDTAVISDSHESASAYVNKVFAEYRPAKIYYDELPEGAELLLYGIKKHSFSGLNNTENISVKSVIINKNYCTHIKTDDLCALICLDPAFEYSALPEDFKGADVIISRSNYPVGAENSDCSLVVINAEAQRAEAVKKTLDEKDINCITTGGNGNVIIRAENGKISAKRE